MIVLDCAQGSPQWVRTRLGVVTASASTRIVTNTGKLSTQRRAYMDALLSEWATGNPSDSDYMSDAMLRGVELEDEARRAYAFHYDATPTAVGFVFRDEARRVGCSPDGLIGDAGLEIKCPLAHTHIGRLLHDGTLPTEYIGQVQFSLWVTGLPVWYWMSYHPSIEPVRFIVEPDPVLHAIYDEEIPRFLAEMDQAWSYLEAEHGLRKAVQLCEV